MLRKELIGLLAICFIFMANGTSIAEVRYTITDLGTLSGDSRANAINDMGQVVGYSYLASGDYHAFRWDPNEVNGTTGVMVDLGVLDGDVRSVANGINNSGYVCGDSGRYVGNDYINKAFIHDGNQMYMLSDEEITFEVVSTGAASINQKGQIAGTINHTSLPALRRCFRWDPCSLGDTNGVMHNLGTLAGGDLVSSMSINDNGQVCGFGEPADPRNRVGYLTDPNGSIAYHETTMLDTTDISGAYGYSVNNKQHAVGFNICPIYPSGWKATIWHAYNRIYSPGSDCYNSPPITLGAGFLPGGDKANAYSINESDEVVGYSESSKGNRAFYWSSSEGMIDLNDYIHPGSGWTLQYAKGINEIGQIVGWGINPDGDTRGFLLTYECPYDIVGDLDGNCKIELVDFALMAKNWLLDCRTNPSDPACVLKGD